MATTTTMAARATRARGAVNFDDGGVASCDGYYASGARVATTTVNGLYNSNNSNKHNNIEHTSSSSGSSAARVDKSRATHSRNDSSSSSVHDDDKYRGTRTCAACCSSRVALLVCTTLMSLLCLATAIVGMVEINTVLVCRTSRLPVRLNALITWTKILRLLDLDRCIVYLLGVFGNLLPARHFVSDSLATLLRDELSRGGTYTGSSADLASDVLRALLSRIDTAYSATSSLSASDVRALRTQVSRFHARTLPSVMRTRNAWSRQVQSSYVDVYPLQDNTRLLTADKQTVLRRPGQLLQQAYRSCHALPSCWTGNGKVQLDAVASLSTSIATPLLSVVMEVLNDELDPLRNATSMSDVVARLTQAMADHAKVVVTAQATLPQLRSLLDVSDGSSGSGSSSRSSSSSSSDIAELLCAVNDYWADNLYASVQTTLELTASIVRQYATMSPMTAWTSRSSSSVLSRTVNTTTPMALMGMFDSYFAHDIGYSLNVTHDDSEAAALAERYASNAVNSFFRSMNASLSTHMNATTQALLSTSALCDTSSRLNTRPALIVYVTTGAAGVCVALAMLCVLRYHVHASPVPFAVVVALTLLLCAVQFAAGGVVFYAVNRVAHYVWQFTSHSLDEAQAGMAQTRVLSSLVTDAMQLALLISDDAATVTGNYTSLRRAYAAIRSSGSDTVDNTTSDTTWMSNMDAFFETMDQYLLGTGYLALYHQLTAAIAGPLTKDQLLRYYTPQNTTTTTTRDTMTMLAMTTTAAAAADDALPVSPRVDEVARVLRTATHAATPTSDTSVDTCKAGMAVASLGTLTYTYASSMFMAMVMSGQLTSTTSACTLSLSSNIDGFCTVAAFVDSTTSATQTSSNDNDNDNNDNDDNKGTAEAGADKAHCYVKDVCGTQASYGMIDSICDGTGVFSIFDPTASNANGDNVGTLVQLAARILTIDIPQRDVVVIDKVNSLSQGDMGHMQTHSRLLTWSAIIGCVVIEVVALILWHLVFGNTIFYSLL